MIYVFKATYHTGQPICLYLRCLGQFVGIHLTPLLGTLNIFFNAYINHRQQDIFTKYTYFYSRFDIWHAFSVFVYANKDKKEPLPSFKHHQTCVKPTNSSV